MSDIHELAAFYALDALDPADADRFEAHLPSCDQCRAELAMLAPGVERLVEAVAEPAPAEMRESVMAAVAAQSEPAVVRLPLRRRRWAWSAAVAAAVVAVVVATGIFRATPQERLDDLLAAPDARTIVATGGPASVEVVFSPGQGVAALVSDSLPAVGTDQTYEMWLIGAGGPVPAGLFVPDEEGRVVAFLEGDPVPGLVVGVTVEPSGGSPSPTGDVLVALEI